jgi:cell division protein FtsQ
VGAAAVRGVLLHDNRFVLSTSDDIQVSGNAHLSRMQVLGVFAPDLERNIFRMSLTERRADLERLPWVQHAIVMRLLPNHVRVQIIERTPVAFVRQGTQIGMVDSSGVLLDMPSEDAGDPRYSFPVLTGIAAEDPLSTRAARLEVYQQFMRELDGSGQKLSNAISEVDVSNPEDVKALVTSGGSDILVHFGDENFLARYNEFEQHLPQWKTQYPRLASADMRYEGQIVLEMQPGIPPTDAKTDAAAVAPTSSMAATTQVPKGEGLDARTGSPSAAVSKPAAKPVVQPAAKKAVSKPAVKPVAKSPAKPVLKPVHATAKTDANAKMYAALAAAHKASQSKSPGGSGATP